jgi:hypothetical protein
MKSPSSVRRRVRRTKPNEAKENVMRCMNEVEEKPGAVQSITTTNAANMRPSLLLMIQVTANMPAGQVQPFHFNAGVVYGNAKKTHATMQRPEAQEVIRRLQLDGDLISNIGVGSEVLLELAKRKERLEVDGQARAERDRAADLKRRMMADIRHQVAFGFITSKTLGTLLDVRSKTDVAVLLRTASALLTDLPAQAKRLLGCTDEELEEAAVLGDKLLTATQAAAPPVDPEGLAIPPDLLDRTWTYLVRAQDQAERVAAVLFGKAGLAEHCPPLTSREIKRRKVDSEPKPADAKEGAAEDKREPKPAEGKPAEVVAPVAPGNAKPTNGSSGPQVPSPARTPAATVVV